MTYENIIDDEPEQNKVIEDRDDYLESFKEELDDDDIDYEVVE